MDNQKRTFLWLALAAISFFIMTKWNEFNAPKIDPNQQVQISNQTSSGIPNSNRPANSDGAVPTISGNTPTTQDNSQQVNANTITHIKTDVLDIKINARGDIVQAGLITYPESLEKKNSPFILLANTQTKFFITQSGLMTSPESPNKASPNHNTAIFSAAHNEYILKDGENELTVPLTWTDESGMTVTKTYIFKRAQFDITFNNVINNQSTNTWIGSEYRQLAQSERPQVGGFLGMGAGSSYTGAVYSTPDKYYQKEAFKDIGKPNNMEVNLKVLTQVQDGVNSILKVLAQAQDSKNANLKVLAQAQGGWFAMIEHYFIAAWVPSIEAKNIIYTHAMKNSMGSVDNYIMGMTTAKDVTVLPNESHTFSSTLYLGPKIQKNLSAIAPKLELTVDYGWMWYISGFLFKLMVWFHGLIGNWGWSIMLVTLSVKAALYWFAAKGFTSMARMRKFTPELTRLKEQYGEDKQKLNQEMMALYRKEKINPMSGCWPMLIQIPIFISLYWMLIESVELRQAPWALWIHDLSLMDPYYVLPLIMGATMFIQQRLNPAPPDPMQAKIMMYMPVVFTVMFLWFPSGLVLYWIVNNTLSILQQWFITKRIEAGNNKPIHVSLKK